MSSEFYVGYFDKPPGGVAKFIRFVVIILVLGIIGVSWLIASKQRGFVASTYEYYKETEVTGLMIAHPIPAIQVNWGIGADQMPIVQTIPIVQFGKKGGDELTKQKIGSWVTAKGHLIYYDGKTLLEISDPSNLVISNSPGTDLKSPAPINYGAKTSFEGEIIDAKCFFGVMRPGHNKPHRSCAIRCISGGIPAVLRSKSSTGTVTYHLIVSEDESADQLASHVGELVRIEGMEGRFYDWKVLKIDESVSIESLSAVDLSIFSNGLSMCY